MNSLIQDRDMSTGFIRFLDALIFVYSGFSGYDILRVVISGIPINLYQMRKMESYNGKFQPLLNVENPS